MLKSDVGETRCLFDPNTGEGYLYFEVRSDGQITDTYHREGALEGIIRARRASPDSQ